ncbi:MAG: AMP-binding protein [Burkholderiaceae bacterium]
MSLSSLLIAEGVQLRDLAGEVLSSKTIQQTVEALSTMLQAQFPKGAAIAVSLPNSPAWVIADLAIQDAGMISVPIPDFFTAPQSVQVFQQAGVVGLLHRLGQAQGLALIGTFQPVAQCDACEIAISAAAFSKMQASMRTPHQKLTFTSGSTGSPKGIPITEADQSSVAITLAEALAPLKIQRHLSMLPLPVLLENIAGVYTALRSGIDVLVPDLSRVGLLGSSRFDPAPAVDLITEQAVESMILLPQMLFALVAFLSRSKRRLSSLKFVAGGGAHTPTTLIAQARALGIPVYEGYGLSEAASVVCLNLPGQDRVGSVGRPLAHRRIKTAEDGELLFSDATGGAWTATGDLGSIDAQGFVSIDGRKKNLLITGYGRNVSPEWPETLLLATGAFAQVMVYGEGEAHLSALVFPVHAALSEAEISAAVAAANAQLPDYAQIGDWYRLSQPCSLANGLATANGRIRRDLVTQRLLGCALPRHSLITLEEVCA